MKKIILIFGTIFLIFGMIFLMGFACFNILAEKSEYNIIVTNNSDEELKSIGVSEGNSSGGGARNADNSPIKKGEDFKFYIQSGRFYVSITDMNDSITRSDEIIVNINEDENIKYKISLEKYSNDQWEFKLEA